MVGPRSTGCRRCVSRRIKCDETRPRCNRCMRAKFECPGYSPLFQFLTLDTTKCTNCLQGDFACVRKGSKCTRCRRNGLECDLNKDPFVTDDQGGASQSSNTSHSNPTELPTSTTIPLTPNVFNEDIYCAFFLDRFFSFGAWNEELQYNRAWMWSALQYPFQSPVSNLALRSMVTAFFGNANHNAELANNALELHGQTLRALNRTIKENGRDVSFDCLSATFLLALYEACNTTSPTAWLDHVTGAKMLFEMKGSEYFRHRPARSLLMFSRLTIMGEALISRKRCFLEQQEWKDALQSDDDVYSRTIQLGNILSSLPGILEDISNIEVMHPTDVLFHPQFKLIFHALLQQIDELRAWWDQWSAEPQRLPQRIRIDEDLEKQINELYPAGIPPTVLGEKSVSVLRLHSLEAAAGHCRYHAHFLAIIRWLNRLLLLQDDTDIVDMEELTNRNLNLVKADETSSVMIVDFDHMIPHAHAVCEILPTYSLPQYRHVGAMYMGMPARIAWRNLPKDSPHVKWIEGFLEAMADSSGFQLPRCLLQDEKPMC